MTRASIGVPRRAALGAAARERSTRADGCRVTSAVRVAGCAVVGAIPWCTTDDGPVQAAGIILTGVQVVGVSVGAPVERSTRDRASWSGRRRRGCRLGRKAAVRRVTRLGRLKGGRSGIRRNRGGRGRRDERLRIVI